MSNSTISSTQAYVNYLVYVTNAVVYYPVLITLPIGLIGNLFSMYIYSRPNLNKKTNTGFLYSCFCFLNIVLISYFAFVFRASFLFGYSVSGPCGMTTYWLRVIWCTIPWILVFISFDRFVAVVFPLKKHILTKKWLICLILLGILIFVVVISITNVIYTVTPVVRGNITVYTCVQNSNVNMATSILTNLARIYIPFAFMITFNLVVLRRLRQSKIRVGVAIVTQMGQQPQTGQLSNKEYRFFMSTLFIDITFFVFYTPLGAFITLWSVVTLNRSLFDSVSYNMIYLFYSAVQVLTLIYSMASFFIFAYFNRYFRGEVIGVLRLRKFFPTVFNESVSILNGSASIAQKERKLGDKSQTVNPNSRTVSNNKIISNNRNISSHRAISNNDPVSNNKPISSS